MRKSRIEQGFGLVCLEIKQTKQKIDKPYNNKGLILRRMVSTLDNFGAERCGRLHLDLF